MTDTPPRVIRLKNVRMSMPTYDGPKFKLTVNQTPESAEAVAALFNHFDKARHRVIEDFHDAIEKEVRRLLGMWVSELEPWLIFGQGGSSFLGLGTKEHGVILPAGRWKVRAGADYSEDEKTAYDLAYVAGHSFFDDVDPFSDYHRYPASNSTYWPCREFPNAYGAGFWEGYHDAMSGLPPK